MKFQLTTEKGVFVSVPLEQLMGTGKVLDKHANLLLFLSHIDFGGNDTIKLYVDECID